MFLNDFSEANFARKQGSKDKVRRKYRKDVLSKTATIAGRGALAAGAGLGILALNRKLHKNNVSSLRSLSDGIAEGMVAGGALGVGLSPMIGLMKYKQENKNNPLVR